MKKRKFFFVFLFISFFVFSVGISSALMVMPSKVEYNFKPGMEKEITYSVFHNNPDTVFELYVGGDLAEFVKLDKEKIVGGGEFTAKIKLPDNIDNPGKNRILIGVKEIPNEKDLERQGAFIGTAVGIQSVVDVYVPYPGRYLEISLSSHDVNIGEPIKFDLFLDNQGKEDLNITPYLDIFSTEGKVETIYFLNRIIKSQEKMTLTKYLDTSNYNAGNYNAVAVVDYGIPVKSESNFRIGDLVLYLINYTHQVVIGGINKFEIIAESGWNDPIDGAYADVIVSNESGEITSFSTSSTSFEPWEQKTFQGFLDTTYFGEGFYDANITFVYYGREVGKSSSETVQLEFVKKVFNNKLIAISLLAITLLMVIIILIKKYLSKNAK